MSTDYARLMRILFDNGVESTCTTLKLMGMVGVVPPAVPLIAETAKRFLVSEEKEPSKVDEMVRILIDIKQNNPEMYEELVAKLSKQS